VKNHKRTGEQQKDLIFDIFSKCRGGTASSRLQVHSSLLCEQIYLWYKDYLFADVDKMGLEITKVVNRFIKDENISKIPDDKDGFFKYLNTSIKKEKTAFFRENNEKDTIKIPKAKKRKLREVEDFIRMKESQLGRKLTNDERKKSISKWFKEQEYVDLLNSVNVGGISHAGNGGGSETDIVDTLSGDPLADYINKTNREAVLEAVKSVLDKKQERAKPCYRALFTLYCIENYKDCKELFPVLDKNILEICQKEGKNPNQYEIYQEYHPNAKQASAEAQASKNLGEFLCDIETYLKEKNQ